jgi:hypothetical protein
MAVVNLNDLLPSSDTHIEEERKGDIESTTTVPDLTTDFESEQVLTRLMAIEYGPSRNARCFRTFDHHVFVFF